ncbi:MULTISPECIES: FAD-dependent oxidoreductase [unclassified Mycolicibacterium]|uniref:FAD-dependent oxidoreductase n=1 Tax=unclassified Mycolicibacterium TaxID=2636767 RepID=UPI0012DF3DAF|nr:MULTISPECIES: FAD-dependent oxidoreductase [unclassified Mycolicibacterium]MUL81389.1 oxygenase [Mycolicibacterium sp. CBMA 329]MUL87155.1 oxygenase [Mycolicibacterium sp. CBMA 331]MUL98563.1 oxygenase [Mycolicibacterium sp. CBMA 334]MUM28298.1 oxygenase [Mycolicibacterium sp. CBMA 295]MUM37452.1 oxygenase [Mycolicibacterium sp. CBMA 247]
MTATHADVVVVGAGPTGLTLACSLRLHGLSVRVVDGAPGPATTSRANFLHARGSEVLGRIGALGTLLDESLRAMRITSYLGDRPVMTLEFGDPGMRTAAPPMVVSQAKVEATLRARLAQLGVEPEWGRAVVGVQQDGDTVVAELGDGDEIHAQWIVGCDGTSSVTRQQAGIEFPGVKLSERFLLADVHLDWALDRAGTTGWIHPDGVVGAMPMPDSSGRDDLWRLFVYDPELGQKPSESEILERVKQVVPQRTGRAVVVGDAEWLSVFTVHRRLAEKYRNGRILIAGDAAHAHAPFGGQGMLTGIGDAENLAFKLALVIRNLASDALIDTYEAERRPLATEVLRGTSAVTRINVASNPFGRFLRDHVATRLFSLAFVQRWTTYTASQLWVSYRKGPLGGHGRKPRPGDRIEDLHCTRSDGTTTRLHSELGGRWALLLPDGVPDNMESVRRRLGDFVATLHHDGADIMLIRPDAHLAWRGKPDGAEGLDRWLAAALGSGVAR